MSKIQYIINGTFGGYKSYLHYSEKIEIEKFNFIDLRNDEIGKGKSCYSLSFQNECYIISKIQIILDGKGDSRYGFIKFNLIIPIEIKLISDIINLLDECLLFYTNEAMNNNFVLIDKVQNTSFKSKIEQKINEIEIENKNGYKWSSGMLKPAYIFINKDQIHSFLEYEKIFQIEYRKYHEIYFIEENDKGEEGILNALKHEPEADLTDKVYLEKLSNPTYTIKHIESDPKITCSGINNGQEVKLNDFIELVFNKKNFEAQDKGSYSGKLSDLLNKNPSIFKKSIDSHNTIEIHEPIFKPLQHEVTLSILDENGKRISFQDLDVKFIQERNSIKNKHAIKNGAFTLVGELIDLPYKIEIESNKDEFRKFIKEFTNELKPEIILEKKNDKKSDKQDKLINIIICVLISATLFGASYFIYTKFIKEEPAEIVENPELLITPNNIEINKYLIGDSLILSKLNKYNNQNLPDSLKEKLQKCIEFRSAINGSNRNKIQFVYDSIKNLNDVQNNILKFIL